MDGEEIDLDEIGIETTLSGMQAMDANDNDDNDSAVKSGDDEIGGGDSESHDDVATSSSPPLTPPPPPPRAVNEMMEETNNTPSSGRSAARQQKQLEKMQRKVSSKLDLHYITLQIIAMAPPRRRRNREFANTPPTKSNDNNDSDQNEQQQQQQQQKKKTKKKLKGNDIYELSSYLERRHKSRYLLFNVSDDEEYATFYQQQQQGSDDDSSRSHDDDDEREENSMLSRQVVHLPWGSPSSSSSSSTTLDNNNSSSKSSSSSGTPSISRIMDICYALHAYLSSTTIPPQPPRSAHEEELLNNKEDNITNSDNAVTTSATPTPTKEKKSKKHHHRTSSNDSRNSNNRTVACIYCGNGKTRTGVTIACYLRFSNQVSTSLNGFEIFCERRGIMSSSSVTQQHSQQSQQQQSQSQQQQQNDISSYIPPSLRRFFTNFDTLVTSKQYPHPEILILTNIQLQGVPVDDMPCIDIWEHGNNIERKRIYTSHNSTIIDDNNDNEGSNNDDENNNNNNWEDEEGYYKLSNIILKQDFTLVCRFGGEFACDADDPSKVLFRYVNNPHFIYGGDNSGSDGEIGGEGGESLILTMADVDMMRRYANSFDEEDFLLTLIFESVAVHDTNTTTTKTTMTILDDEVEIDDDTNTLGIAKFDGRTQHSESDIILQGWRIISDAHLFRSNLTSTEGCGLVFNTDLDPSIFKLVCPGGHIIDFISIALQITNGNEDMAKTELLDGLFHNLFSSSITTATQRFPFDVAPTIIDETSDTNNDESIEVEDHNSLVPQDCAPDIFPSNQDEPSDMQSLPINMPTVGTSSPPSDCTTTKTKLSRLYDCPVYEKYYLMLKRGLSVGLTENVYHRAPPPSLLIEKLEVDNDVKVDNVEQDEPALDIEEVTELDCELQRHGPTAAPLSVIGDAEVYDIEQIDENIDPRIALTSLLSKRIPSQSADERVNAAATEPNEKTQDQIQEISDPRAALSLMLKKRAPPAEPMGHQRSEANIDLDPRNVITPPATAIETEYEERDEHNEKAALASFLWMRSPHLHPPSSSMPRDYPCPNPNKYHDLLERGDSITAVNNAMQMDEEENPAITYVAESENAADDDDTPLDDEEAAAYEEFLRMRRIVLNTDEAKKVVYVEDPMMRVASQQEVVVDILHANKESVVNDSSQEVKEVVGDDPPLGEDPLYAKYFKMLQMGLPIGAVKNALQRDGLDPSIMDLDATKSLSSQVKAEKEVEDSDPPLGEDPKYAKYFKMLKMNLPIGAVKNALQRDELDPSIMDLDATKSLSSQVKAVKKVAKQPYKDRKINDKSPPLKDDPTYSKFFKMLKMGLSMGAVKNAVTRDGLDPSILDKDPEKSLEDQNVTTSKSEVAEKKAKEPPKPSVKRKKIFWSPIEESKIDDNSLWSMIKGTIDFESLNVDQDEFESLFTDTALPTDKKKILNDKSSEPKQKKSVQAIDAKRGMNGGIVLARIKVEFAVLAEMVSEMDCGKLDDTQLKALSEYLPTSDERFAIEGYLKSFDSQTEEVKISAINDLCLCEKYMLAMMKVDMANEKFDCMLFKYQFDNKLRELNQGVTTLTNACEEVMTSARLRKLMAMILMLGNQINTGGSGRMAQGFSLDALLKLDEAKAFDKKTSVLQYLVKLVKTNDSDLLNVREEIPSLGTAENVVVDGLVNELNQLNKQLQKVKETATAEGDRVREGKTHVRNSSALEKLRQQKSKIRVVEEVSMYNTAESYTQIAMEKFAKYAENRTNEAFSRIEAVQENFKAVLTYFGENPSLSTTDFFGTLNKFIAAFDVALEHVKRIEEREIADEKRAAARRIQEEKKRALAVIAADSIKDMNVTVEVIDEVTVEATRRKSELKDTCKNMDRKEKDENDDTCETKEDDTVDKVEVSSMVDEEEKVGGGDDLPVMVEEATTIEEHAGRLGTALGTAILAIGAVPTCGAVPTTNQTNDVDIDDDSNESFMTSQTNDDGNDDDSTQGIANFPSHEDEGVRRSSTDTERQYRQPSDETEANISALETQWKRDELGRLVSVDSKYEAIEDGDKKMEQFLRLLETKPGSDLRCCASCGGNFSKDSFSGNQWKKGVGQSRCSTCVEGGGGGEPLATKSSRADQTACSAAGTQE